MPINEAGLEWLESMKGAFREMKKDKILQCPDGTTIEFHKGNALHIFPQLLAKQELNEGYILDAGDIRKLHATIGGDIEQCYCEEITTSTLSAAESDKVKIILPYTSQGRMLTAPAQFGLKLINIAEEIEDSGAIDLSKYGRWEKYNEWKEEDGVYTRSKEKWFINKEGYDGKYYDGLTKTQALRCPCLLTSLGHPDFVHKKFAREISEIEEIIEKIFRGRGRMAQTMGICLPRYNTKPILTPWNIEPFTASASSVLEACTSAQRDWGFAYTHATLKGKEHHVTIGFELIKK